MVMNIGIQNNNFFHQVLGKYGNNIEIYHVLWLYGIIDKI